MPARPPRSAPPGHLIGAALCALLVWSGTGCEDDSTAEPTRADAALDAEPADADPDQGDVEPVPGQGECPEEEPTGLEPCAADGLSCSYPRGECPCGDPHDHYLCDGETFTLEGSDSGCENAASDCNGAACAEGPGGACEPEGESCWFQDGEDPETGLELYRRWQCEGGLLVMTEDTHVPVF